MTRIGIMSFAHLHAHAYAAGLAAHEGAELSIIWDDDESRGKAASEQYGAPYTNDAAEFFEKAGEGVIITSENVKHRAMAEQAAAAGKWILCEKPLATTVEDAQAMVDACKQAGVGLGVAYPCRFIPAVEHVKEQLESGALGELVAASCTNNGQFPGGWFADESLSGGGATMDHTVHVADLLRWMTGREFTTVYCENGNLLRPGINTDDIGSVHFEMDGGFKIAHVGSWNRCDSFPTWGDVTMEIVGTGGVIYLDAFNQKLNVYNDDDVKAAWAYWGGDPNARLVADFVASIQEKRDPCANGVDGVRTVAVSVAACESAKANKPMTVAR